MNLAYYITGHGFGHATRAIVVMNALHARRNDLHFHIRSRASRTLFDRYLSVPHTVSDVAIDVGVKEKDQFHVDIAGTASALKEFLPREQRIVEEEAAFLKRERIQAVIFDAPPLAALIAERAGIPSIGIGNFTWDFIYESFRDQDLIFEEYTRHTRELHAHATLFLRLPLSHEMTGFPRLEDVPLIGRAGTGDREATRHALGIGKDQVAVLAVLRGEALRIGSCAESNLVVWGFGDIEGPCVRNLDDRWQQRYTDVLGASDVVLSKIGYGVVSECILSRKPMIEVPRFGFSETAVVREEMRPFVPTEQLTLDELREGKLAQVALRLAGQKPEKEMRQDGPQVVAERILALLS